ncbi:MAG: hypothetical protein ABI791_01540 [Acidobacteriota bacterium]
MNSEELELSLRAEFESYLKDVFAKVRQDVSDFQRNFESEFEKHKTQLDETVRDLSARFESDPGFDRAFTESITEHLRLARDAGATITAEAIGEAEKLKSESDPVVSYDRLRDAIKDITSQTSQAAILRSLVDNAGEFAPRGAFFIVKNDHFVGWRVFGKEGKIDDAAVQEIHFPVSDDTLISAASSSLVVQDGNYTSHADDSAFLEPLGFDRPDRMVAIPLIARGRGVAVMYADYGMTGVSMNADALETLVRVAGLAVELLAAANEVKAQQEAPAVAPEPAPQAYVEPTAAPEPETVAAYHDESPSAYAFADTEIAAEEPAAVYAVEEYTGDVSFETEAAQPEAVPEFNTPVSASFMEDSKAAESEITYLDTQAGSNTQSEAVETSDDLVITAGDDVESPVSDWVEPAVADEASWSEPELSPEPAVGEYAVNGNGNGNGGAHTAVAEPVVEVAATQPVRSRFSDRNVDLPVEVADEEERRMHNDARRFARLLVSEIKLYNQEKVVEGRESHDLYDRLRDAIDRSREMYEKRVKPQVASRFDYFHYELVNGIAEGKDERLGSSYPRSGA